MKENEFWLITIAMCLVTLIIIVISSIYFYNYKIIKMSEMGYELRSEVGQPCPLWKKAQ